MSYSLLLNPTVTGGTATVLIPINQVGNRAQWAFPTHTRLTPHTLSIVIEPANTTSVDPGVARTSFKISKANRLAEEGCCTVKAGTVIIDVGVRWPLAQPSTEVDTVVADLQALVNSPSFKLAIISGLYPV